MSHSHEKEWARSLTTSDLAKLAGISKRQVQRAVAGCVKAGLIVIERDGKSEPKLRIAPKGGAV